MNTEGTNSSRRVVISGAIAVTASSAVAALSYPLTRYLTFPAAALASRPPTLTVCDDSDLQPGSFRIVLFGCTPVVVLRRPGGALIALSAECTHLGCTLRWDPDRDELACGCHGATFDPVTGRVRRGPASSPLVQLHAEVRDGRIIVSA